MRGELYRNSLQEPWNAFVSRSKNGTFLYDRNYMDYHADRFTDCSVIFYNDDDRIIGLLPASRHGRTIVSHGGLTYGGVVCDTAMKAGVMLTLFDSMLETLRREGGEELIYKPSPHIFHRYPSEEDLYALYRFGARLVRRDASSAVCLQRPVPFAKGKREGVRKARRAGVEVRRSDDFSSFFAIGQRIMRDKYNKEPVHSVEEMKLLHGRFPGTILLHGAFDGTRMLAGAIVYVCPPTLHLQYMYSSPDGQNVGALDLILEHIISGHGTDFSYLSFGVSTEDEGRYLNEGLIHQKELFGARTVVHDFYQLEL